MITAKRSTILAIDTLGATGDLLAEAAAFYGKSLCIMTPAPERVAQEIPAESLSNVEFVACDFSDHESVFESVRRLSSEQNLCGVLISSDRAALVGAMVASQLNLPAHTTAAMRICRDKGQTRRALAAAGLKTVLFAEVATVDAATLKAKQLGFPLIVKDPCGTGSANVYVVNSIAEMQDAVEAILAVRNSVLIEEFLCGPLFSAECVIEGGGITVLGYSNRDLTDFPDFNELGLVFPADLPAQWTSTIDKYVRDVIVAVGLTHGFAHIEFILTRDGPQIVEVNPRMGGASIGRMLSTALDHNVFKIAVCLGMGLKPPIPRSIKQHVGCKIIGAKKLGKIKEINGEVLLPLYPGFESLHLVRRQGDSILSTRDYRNTVGYLQTVATSAALAYDFARAASASLVVDME